MGSTEGQVAAQTSETLTSDGKFGEQVSISRPISETSIDHVKTAKIPNCNGVYIKGYVQGIPAVFTVDSGASRTIISTNLFKKIPQGLKPSLDSSKRVNLVQAG